MYCEGGIEIELNLFFANHSSFLFSLGLDDGAGRAVRVSDAEAETGGHTETEGARTHRSERGPER